MKIDFKNIYQKTLLFFQKYKSRRMIICLPVVLIFLTIYIISIIILMKNYATYNSILWLTLIYLIVLIILLKHFLHKTKSTKIDLIGILSIIIAGLLTIQLNQPLFSPSISEYNKIDNIIENWIYWPWAIGTEKFKIEIYQYSNYEITVLLPLFPFDNSVSPFKNNQEGSTDIFSVVTEIRGPVIHLKNKDDLIYCTTVDGFSIRSAKVFTKTITKIPYQHEIEVKCKDYNELNWKDLTKSELDFFSSLIFSNRINLYKYFNDNIYSDIINKKFKIDISMNGISFDIEQPDFFDLESCIIEIQNKSHESQILKFKTEGMYPRYFFSRNNDILDNANNSDGIFNLHSGFLPIAASQSMNLNIIELKQRRTFDQIFPEKN